MVPHCSSCNSCRSCSCSFYCSCSAAVAVAVLVVLVSRRGNRCCSSVVEVKDEVVAEV